MTQQPAYPIRRWNPSLTPRGTTPRSPCPYCFLDGHSSDTSQLMSWRCPRGHEWTSTRQQAERHAVFCAQYFTGVMDNR